MKKKVKIYVLALVAVILVGAFLVHFDDIREYKKECEEYMDDAYEARTERLQGVLREQLEEDAYKLIEEEYGVKPLRFGYLPEGLVFDTVEFNAENEYAILRYVGEDSTWIELYVIDPHRSDFASDVVAINETIQLSYRIETDDVNIQVDQFKNSDSEKTMMHSQLIKNKVRYTFLSYNIAPVEYDKIVGNLVFDE